MPNPYLDFFEKHLPQHVSKAMGDRLAARKQKKPVPHGEEQSPGEENAESPEAEQQEDSGIAGAAQENEGESAVPPSSGRRVFMMPSESDGRRRKGFQPKAAPMTPARKPAPLKPRVLGR